MRSLKKVSQLVHSEIKNLQSNWKIKARKTVTVAAMFALLLPLLGFSVPVAIQADSNSVDFESFSPGSVDGQDGWSATGPYDQEVVANTYGYGAFGTQSLRVSDAVASGSFGDWIFAKPLTDAAGEADSTNGAFSPGTLQPHFEAQFDIASTTPDAQQPDMHLSVSPDRGDGSRMSYLRFEDQGDGIHVFFDDVTSTQTPDSDIFNETDIATLDRTVPHTVKFSMDLVDGPSNDVVKIYIDGNPSPAASGTSWEDYYRYDSEASGEQSPRIINTLIIQARGSSTPADQGFGFLFDNLSLASGPTPPDESGTVKVTVVKYLDGSAATAGSANSTEFPMESTWTAENLNGGAQTTGNYSLGPVGFNNPNPYQATTSDMTTGADYTTHEILGDIVGATCDDGKPYALSGYSSGDTLDAAENAATTPTAPQFTGLTSDKFVIVRNISCGPLLHFIKVLCPNWSDVAGNKDAQDQDPLHDDDTGGQFVNFNNYSVSPPNFPDPYTPKPIGPGEIPQNCHRAAGWHFDLTNLGPANLPPPAVTVHQDVGPTDANGEATLPASGLNPVLNAQLSDGGFLWVSEVTQPQAPFAAIRCSIDAEYGDNLEEIHLAVPGGSLPDDTYCIAYNIGELPVQHDTTFHFIKTVCSSFEDIDGNESADLVDATGGHFTEFANYSAGNPHFPAPYAPKPIAPAEIPQNCARTPDWHFNLSAAQFPAPADPAQQDVGPTDANGEAEVTLDELDPSLSGPLLAGGDMWVSEKLQEGTSFGAIRCYTDAVNGDNLELIKFSDPQDLPADVYCIAYNVELEPPHDQTGGITVCKIILDDNGNVVDGSQYPGNTFTVPGLTPNPVTSVGPPAGQLTDTVFPTPLTLDSNLLTGDGNDAQCKTQTGLTLGGYYYDQEDITPGGSDTAANWLPPKYNDQFTDSVNDTSDMHLYSDELFDGDAGNDDTRDQNADGHLVLTVDRPNRTIIVLNQHQTPPEPCVATELILNGGFEAPVVGTAENWDIFSSGTDWLPAWNGGITSFGGSNRPDPTVELHRNVSGWAPHSGQQHTELDSDWFGPSNPLTGEPASVTISQTLTTVPGGTYTVSFWTSPRPGTGLAENSNKFSWNGSPVDTINEDGSANSNTVWTQHTYSLVATGASTVISFTDLGVPDDSLGTFLDDVSVVRDCDPDNGGGGNGGPFTLTVTITGEGAGTVSSGGDGFINCHEDEGSCNHSYPAATVVNLTAVADSGSTFNESWAVSAGSCTGNTTPCSVTMSNTIALTAHFTLDTGGQGGSGGNGGGRSGGSSGGSNNQGQVLGDTTSIPFVPQGQVLGESTTLPRTGTSNMALLLLLAPLAAPFIFKRSKFVKQA